MLRIAVCDDDKDAVQIHKGIVEDCLRQYGSMAVWQYWINCRLYFQRQSAL